MKVSNWNSRPEINNAQLIPFNEGEKMHSEFCPRGSGRSYGDASLNRTMIDCTENKKLLELKGDVLTVSAGFTIREILNFCIPKGYILPVIPGTQHPTVGGMIAADVHGKNHETHGSIGRWVEWISIQNSDGKIVDCSPTENIELYQATIGGLGLTGVIISATFKLIKLNTVYFDQKVTRQPSLESLIDALDKSEAEHKTGWFDFLSMEHFLLLENNAQKEGNIPDNFQLKNQKSASLSNRFLLFNKV